MNEITQLSVICTHVTHDTNGKAKEIKRRFNNINTRASEADIKLFVTTISNLIEESFDKVEVVKTQGLV